MSNTSYSLIDDDQTDQIDDQETMINVGNLIIDLETDLEQEKNEDEQANVKTLTTTSSSSSHSSKVSAFSGGTNSEGPVKNSRSSNRQLVSSSTNNNNNSNNTNMLNNNNNNNSKNNSTINFIPGGRLTNNSTVAGNNISTNNSNNGTSTRGELRMRITRETKPGKSEHKIVTSPNQKSPTSSGGGFVLLSNEHQSLDDTKNIIYAQNQGSSSISSTKECGTSTSVGTITEPDCLGPCEPGTSVSLEGIVWQETEGGILVVNVTWRGKTYVGALLDCTKHDWAPPRLCDSPTSDIDSKASKGVRPKRIVTRSNGAGLDEKNLLQTTGKLRNGKGRKIPTSDLAPCSKRQRESDKTSENPAAQTDAVSQVDNVSTVPNSETKGVPNTTDTTSAPYSEQVNSKINDVGDKPGPNSPMLIGCNEPNCSKQYRNVHGLLYHKAHAHSAENENANAADGDCSSSSTKKQGDSSNLEPQADEETNKLGTDNLEQIREKNESSSQPERSSLEPSIVISDQRLSQRSEPRQEPSPQLSSKYMSSKIDCPTINDTPHNHESRSNATKIPDALERHNVPQQYPVGNPIGEKSAQLRPIMDIPQGFQPGPIQNNNNFNNNNNNGSSNHSQYQPQQQHSSSMSSSSSSKHLPSSKQMANQTNNQPPSGNDEGMKPSGTSTGPPPAPHQANCYLNSAFLNSIPTFNLNNHYFPRPPLPIFDPPTSSPNAFSRHMNQIRPPNPGPESPSMIPKNTPFAPFKPDPNALPPLPNQYIGNPPPLPLGASLPPLGGQPPQLHPPPLGGNGSPHLRLPGQIDQMAPPNSQGLMPPLPFPLGLPPFPPHLLGAMGRPPAPGMLEDPQGKPFPGRFN